LKTTASIPMCRKTSPNPLPSIKGFSHSTIDRLFWQ
jgi:hypothetical protein